jgi:hypothetical protein
VGSWTVKVQQGSNVPWYIMDKCGREKGGKEEDSWAVVGETIGIGQRMAVEHCLLETRIFNRITLLPLNFKLYTIFLPRQNYIRVKILNFTYVQYDKGTAEQCGCEAVGGQ